MNMRCDPESGACALPENDARPDAVTGQAAGRRLHYIGDPMCSWCWALAPVLAAAADFCAGRGIAFTMTMGGLRAGGGDAWNEAFRNFLRGEWQNIAQRTGQEFGFRLLDAAHFNYDTEPACRAVVSAQILQAEEGLPPLLPLQFMAAVQRRFYVAGEDPKELPFYAAPCREVGLDFAAFSRLFASAKAKAATQAAFRRCRELGVRSFPTLLFEQAGKVELLAAGYIGKEELLARLQEKLAA